MTLPLFQFWNSVEPPVEVTDLLQTWQSQPGFEYRCYNTATADAYIAKHIGDRALQAFRRCAVPAMQADFFRYCALYIEGGVYVDADTTNGGDLHALIAPHPRALLMTRQVRVANDFLFFRTPKDRLLYTVIQIAINNIEKEISNNVWAVTGPGIMSGLFHDEKTKPLFAGIGFEPAALVRKTVVFRNDLLYKSADADWRSFAKDTERSIFTPKVPEGLI